MSNVRVRYMANEDKTVLTSRRLFTTSAGVQVKAELDLVNKKFRIVDATSGAVVAEGGDTINLAVLKISCKQALVGLGASFEEEARERKEVETSFSDDYRTS